MFRSVGKMFMSATKEEVTDHLALQKVMLICFILHLVFRARKTREGGEFTCTNTHTYVGDICVMCVCLCMYVRKFVSTYV